MIYYVSYMLLLVMAAVLEMESPNDRSLKKLLLTISSTVTVIFVGFRKEVGGDWFAYMNYHEAGYVTPFLEFIQTSDPGYMAISWVLGRLGMDIWSLNTVLAILLTVGISTLALQVRYSNLFFLSAAPYLIIVVGMGYSRQSGAIGMLCISISYLFQNRRVRAVGFGVVSLLFHKSAAFCLTPVLMASSNSRWKNIAILFLGIPVIALFVFLEAFEIAQKGYIEAEYSSAGAFIRVLQIFICGVWALLFLVKYEDENRKKLLTLLSGVAVLSMPALIVSPSSTLVDRLILYLLPFQCYVLSRVPDLFAYGASRITACVSVISINFLIFFVWITSAVHLDSWINYKSYLW